MIDISHYINKLEVLKEYMGLLIDGKLRVLIDLDTLPIPAPSPDQLLALFYQTGVLFHREEPQTYPAMKPTSFEEYFTQIPRGTIVN